MLPTRIQQGSEEAGKQGQQGRKEGKLPPPLPRKVLQRLAVPAEPPPTGATLAASREGRAMAQLSEQAWQRRWEAEPMRRLPTAPGGALPAAPPASAAECRGTQAAYPAPQPGRRQRRRSPRRQCWRLGSPATPVPSRCATAAAPAPWRLLAPCSPRARAEGRAEPKRGCRQRRCGPPPPPPPPPLDRAADSEFARPPPPARADPR
jgi:hypothetical protein